MTNSSLSSELSISQEIENPSSFNFSIPLLEESPSTPVCSAGETGESITHHTEVVASPAPPSGKVLPCLPTLILSGEKSQNLEAQSVAKPSGDLPTEEVEVVSKAVSSTMSERLFDGDLPEGRGPKSNILAASAKLMVVQSLASLRGEAQPTLLEKELRSPEQVPHSVQPVFDQTPKSFDVASEEEEEEEVPLKWSRKGVRGANFTTTGVSDLEGVNIVPDTDLNNEPTESAKERKIKGKGKMVMSYTKGDKKRYGTKIDMQKVMGSAIATNVIQMERARKRRREDYLPEEPTSTLLLVGSSDTKSDDVVVYVEKRRKEAEVDRVKSKGVQKSTKKSHVKKVSKRATEQSKPIKVPGPRIQKPVE
ncbi:hypothetical protein KY289_010684 [Solanum tuberosum]|uniref:Uncharacterized protein n=1 Tax=Solanum tuberosum TaxID=4113 RepID=M1DH88_SOLTU|nr:hypothetical protein KY289_010684 [Solanum tuberosum]